MCRKSRSHGYPDEKATKEIEINTNDGRKYNFKVSASVNFNCKAEAEVMSFKLRVNHSDGGWIKISKYTGKNMQVYLNKSIFEKYVWSNDRKVTNDHVDFKDLHKTRFSVDFEDSYAKVPIKITFNDGQSKYLHISWCESCGFSIGLGQAGENRSIGNLVKNFLDLSSEDQAKQLITLLKKLLGNQIQKLLRHQFGEDQTMQFRITVLKKLLGNQIQKLSQLGEDQALVAITALKKLLGNQVQNFLQHSGLIAEGVCNGVGDPEVDAWID